MVIIISIYYTGFLPQTHSDQSCLLSCGTALYGISIIPLSHSNKMRVNSPVQGHLTNYSILETTVVKLHYCLDKHAMFLLFMLFGGVPFSLC